MSVLLWENSPLKDPQEIIKASWFPVFTLFAGRRCSYTTGRLRASMVRYCSWIGLLRFV